MNFAFDIAPVVTRLKGGLDRLWTVETSAEIDAAMTGSSGRTPGAYVVPVKETARPHPGGSSGRLVQLVDVAFAVALNVRNYRAANLGADAIDALTPGRRAVGELLIGWTPPGCDLAIDFEGGKLARYAAGDIWWQDVFRTRLRIEKTVSKTDIGASALSMEHAP